MANRRFEVSKRITVILAQFTKLCCQVISQKISANLKGIGLKFFPVRILDIPMPKSKKTKNWITLCTVNSRYSPSSLKPPPKNARLLVKCIE